MYVLRRHSRRLLLPPGWVALGFLLLLGCRVLLIDKRLQPVKVVNLTMPLLKPDTTGLAAFRRDKTSFPDFSYSGQRSYAELDTARHWCNFNLIGSHSIDSITIERVLVAIKAIQTDTSHTNGVRIHFQQHVAYGNLVRVLDIMKSTNQKIYWFDIQQHPMIFYTLTEKWLPLAKRWRQE